MYRVEDKYACSAYELLFLEARLKNIMHVDRNQTNDNGYVITSIYFDDLCDTHLRDTIEGTSERTKYRIRIYNGSLETIKLEIKYKKYNRILKKSKGITKEQMQQLLLGECIYQEDESSEDVITLFNLAMKQSGLRPKIMIEYDRKAFIYEPGNVRITIDRNLRCSTDLAAFGEVNNNWTYLKEEPHVLEVKYDEFIPGFIEQSLELGELQQTSYSKYGKCRQVGRR